MKKIITAAAGLIIAGVLLLLSVAAPEVPETIEYNEAEICPIKATETEGIQPGGYIPAKVARIVDGDTLTVEYKNEEYKVRLLCIDTPETVKSGVDEQPYGKKATEQLSSMVLNKQVVLIFEKDVDDRYGRLLAYVMQEDGTCVNAAMVEQGLARIDLVKPNTVHREFFNKLQEEAIAEGRGLWSLKPDRRPFVKNEEGYYVPRYIQNEAA